ncbi:MAG: hypothetical protein J7M40_08210, partial [Planctomycetes bacterium]|nr:hypothetical protein [Planctomycetota bacterium]
MRFRVKHNWRYTAQHAMALLLICALAGPISYCTAGGDFFDVRPTELESRKTLREVETVPETPNVHIPRPSVYTDPPQIVEGTVNGKPDAKLYYFTRYHVVDKLVTLFNEQFLRALYDNEGNVIPGVPYTIDSISATHQIIVSCPSVEYAQQVLYFFEQIDVPPIQVRIDCLISEVYADHTLDWETNLQVQNLVGSKIALEGKLPGAALRDLARSSFGMQTGRVEGGYWKEATSNDPAYFVATDPGHVSGALVDLLTSRGYLKILMNPQLEVLNGQTATIRTQEYVTLDQISTINPITDKPFLYPNRVTITDSLEVTPQAFSDGTIGIKTVALIGSKGTPEGIKQIPIVTERRVTIAENRIRRGESLIIGGIRKSEQRSVVRGVPGLKNIPILGILFSSKDFEERAKEILFIITPTISTGGVSNKDIVADIQRKHTPIKNSDLIENLKDPFGSGAYTTLVEQEAIEAEVGRLRAEMEKAAADRKSEELLKKIATAGRQVEGEAKQGERAVATAKTETAAAKAAIVAAKAQAAETQTKIAAAQKLLADEKARVTAAAAEQKQATDAAKTAAGAAAAAAAGAAAACGRRRAAKSSSRGAAALLLLL